jgi:hypothetical protein
MKKVYSQRVCGRKRKISRFLRPMYRGFGLDRGVLNGSEMMDKNCPNKAVFLDIRALKIYDIRD